MSTLTRREFVGRTALAAAAANLLRGQTAAAAAPAAIQCLALVGDALPEA
jgi:hypothetical protein